jgi:hypothetical protein
MPTRTSVLCRSTIAGIAECILEVRHNWDRSSRLLAVVVEELVHVFEFGKG